MRSVGSVTVVLLVVFLAGCGSSGSSSTAGTSAAQSSSASAENGHQAASAGHEERQAGQAATAAQRAEAEEDAEASEDISDTGSYDGMNLCDLDQIEEDVRELYAVDPSTEVACKPAEEAEDFVVGTWNWWVVKPKSKVPHYKSDTPEMEESERIQEELVGEKATAERVEVGILNNHINGRNAWEHEKHDVSNPANELELIEVNGREAIWGAAYLLLTPINNNELLSIATLSSTKELELVAGEPTAIEIAELVEKEAF